MDHLLTPHDDIQEIPLVSSDFLWNTDVSYLKAANGKYCARYVIAAPFGVVEKAPLPMAISSQQTEFYILTWDLYFSQGQNYQYLC